MRLGHTHADNNRYTRQMGALWASKRPVLCAFYVVRAWQRDAWIVGNKQEVITEFCSNADALDPAEANQLIL